MSTNTSQRVAALQADNGLSGREGQDDVAALHLGQSPLGRRFLASSDGQRAHFGEDGEDNEVEKQ
jgi:hypothetical protein